MDNGTQDEAELKFLKDALHELYDPVLAEPVPEHWLSARQRRWPRFAVAAGWMLLGLAVGLVAGWQAREWRSPAPAAPLAGAAPPFVHRAVVAHATYSPEVRHPVEVTADQESHLVAWLSKRLGAPLRAPHLESVGYNLVGGRLLPGEPGSPVAQFMYQCKMGTRVTLYVRANAPANRETAFLYSTEGPVKVFYWIDRKLGYAVSSADIDKETLLKVAQAAYQQLNPE
ncbi:MAG TPA: anti-sigma factor [Burkholderiales bacterium]|jgi:anti-sigma factor RsiW|nr:anti-sigma factor [Burkholderiales bacterium]